MKVRSLPCLFSSRSRLAHALLPFTAPSLATSPCYSSSAQSSSLCQSFSILIVFERGIEQRLCRAFLEYVDSTAVVLAAF
ncbi:hypothetical protein IWZ03DRAFT_202222 [Phyllosticta citriasiana]|uniref:Secreted protein n=1 Tax=Phyllosticta citriasiana TaxID=595635 RepID=A0ABR1KI47_9PEZI